MEDLSRESRENLHKWGKASRLIDEEKVEIDLKSDDRYQLKIQGDSQKYTVGVDIDSGKTFCPCPFRGETCSHQIAAHLHLAELGLENETYRSKE